MRNVLKNNAITLIALVITIVILLILAAVALNLTLGDNGIFKRTKDSALLYKKAEYMEEINLVIADEQTERSGTHKDEAFITSVANKLSPQNKKWVKTIKKCVEVNGTLVEREDDFENNILYILTQENYEILVDIDNSTFGAIVRNSFTKVAGEDEPVEEEKCTITFDANGGQVDQDTLTVTKGGTVNLPIPARNGYQFAGWYTENDELVNNQTVFDEEKTLVAHWNTYVATQNVTILGGKSETITITTPRETISRTLDATGSLSTSINIAMEESITLTGDTSGYTNNMTYAGESTLLARPEHFIYWYGIVNTEYGGISSVAMKSWDGGARLAPTLTYNTNYFTASVSDSDYVNRAGNVQATNNIDLTDFTRIKAHVKSGSVYLYQNGTGINGGISAAVVQASATSRDSTYKEYLVLFRSYETDGRGTSNVGEKKDIELNIENKTGEYQVGIFMSIVCGTTTANTYAIWLE